MKKTKNEQKILSQEEFREKLINYTHENLDERITNAWLDVDSDSCDDKPVSDEFYLECKKIIRGVEKK